MKASELRIGNWIYDSECAPHYFRVEEIRKYVGYELWVYFRKGSIKTKEPEFIPLTEDILVKAEFHWQGFSGFDVFTHVYEQGFQITFKDGEFYFNGYFIGVKLKYLHQLQNLYYALTGKELTIEL